MTHDNARLLRVHFEFVLFESERGEASGRARLVQIGQAVAVGFRLAHEYGAIDGNVGLGAGRHENARRFFGDYLRRTVHVDNDAERLTKRRVAFVGQADEELELKTVALAVATRLAER